MRSGETETTNGVDELDVLVIGAGPAGVTAALFLARAGLRVRCLEKRTTVSPLARARGVHARAMEILRYAGAEQALRERELAIEPRMEVRPSLADPPVASVVTGGPTLAEVSPCEGLAIGQDVFESVLRDCLLAAHPGVLELGVEVLDLVDRPDGVVADVRGADGSRRSLTAAWVVAADGWRSPVRQGLGIGFVGPSDLGTYRAITFRADLTPWLTAPPPGLIRLLRSDGILLSTHPDNRWVLNLPPSDVAPGETVRAALGIPDLRVEVLTDSTWTAAAQTAEALSRGRVFLVGDAAHRVPPAGATGVSSALADVCNLSWKLAAVCSGWAGPELLDSYDAERRPVALATTTAVLEMWRAMTTGAPLAVDLRVLDMGYVYAGSSGADLQAATSPSTSGADPSAAYVPSARVGARAPHVRLDDGAGSTIDLFGSGLVLLTSAAVPCWTEAADRVAAATGVPLRCVVRTESAVAAIYELLPGEAVLVRPDGHVGWRSGAERGADAGSVERRLRQAVLRAVGRPADAAADQAGDRAPRVPQLSGSRGDAVRDSGPVASVV